MNDNRQRPNRFADLVVDLAGLAGAALIVGGVWMIHHGAALIVGGLFVLAAARKLSRTAG